MYYYKRIQYVVLFISLFVTSVAQAQDIGRKLDLAKELQESNPDRAILLSQEVITSIGNSKQEKAYALWNISQANLYKHKYHSSLSYALKARDLYQENDTSLMYQNIVATIGWVYYDISNYQYAVPYHQKALDIAIKRQDLYNEVLYINALGLDALGAEKHNKALMYFKKGESLLDEGSEDTRPLLATIQSNIGAVHIVYEDWDEAESYLLNSIENSNNTASSLLETYASLANVYLHTSDYESCEQCLQKGDSIARQTNYSFSLMEYYIVRSEYEQVMGNFQKAYKYQSRYLDLLVRVKNTETQEVMNYLVDAQNNKIEQDKVIIKQAQEINANKRTILIITVISALLIIIALYYSFYTRSEKIRLKQKVLIQELNEQQLKQEVMSSTLQHKDEIIESLAFTISKRNELVKELGENIENSNSSALKMAWLIFKQSLGKHQNSTAISEDLLCDFKAKLKKLYPSLTEKDILLATNIRANLSSKQIADKYHVEVKSIEMSRYRLRKKLQIAKGESLREFILRV